MDRVQHKFLFILLRTGNKSGKIQLRASKILLNKHSFRLPACWLVFLFHLSNNVWRHDADPLMVHRSPMSSTSCWWHSYVYLSSLFQGPSIILSLNKLRMNGKHCCSTSIFEKSNSAGFLLPFSGFWSLRFFEPIEHKADCCLSTKSISKEINHNCSCHN